MMLNKSALKAILAFSILTPVSAAMAHLPGDPFDPVVYRKVMDATCDRFEGGAVSFQAAVQESQFPGYDQNYDLRMSQDAESSNYGLSNLPMQNEAERFKGVPNRYLAEEIAGLALEKKLDASAFLTTFKTTCNVDEAMAVGRSVAEHAIDASLYLQIRSMPCTIPYSFLRIKRDKSRFAPIDASFDVMTKIGGKQFDLNSYKKVFTYLCDAREAEDIAPDVYANRVDMDVFLRTLRMTCGDRPFTYEQVKELSIDSKVGKLQFDDFNESYQKNCDYSGAVTNAMNLQAARLASSKLRQNSANPNNPGVVERIQKFYEEYFGDAQHINNQTAAGRVGNAN